MARRIQDASKHGLATFGYSDMHPPQPGGTGVLLEVPLESMYWERPNREGTVVVKCRGSSTFKILAVRYEQPPGSGKSVQPLFVADVELTKPGGAVNESSTELSDQELLLHMLLNAGADAQLVDQLIDASSRPDS